MKLLEKLRADARVHSIEDERAFGNGWWCYLAPGWAMCPGTGEAHCFSEDTLAHCTCPDCVAGTTWGAKP